MELEDQQRFTVESGSHYRDGIGVWLVHACGHITDIEPPSIGLAELVQRADEHTEVCR